MNRNNGFWDQSCLKMAAVYLALTSLGLSVWSHSDFSNSSCSKRNLHHLKPFCRTLHQKNETASELTKDSTQLFWTDQDLCSLIYECITCSHSLKALCFIARREWMKLLYTVWYNSALNNMASHVVCNYNTTCLSHISCIMVWPYRTSFFIQTHALWCVN